MKPDKLLSVLLSFFVPFIVITAPTQAACTPGSGALPIPTWYKYVPGTNNAQGGCDVDDNLGGKLVILILMGVFDMLLFLAGFIGVIIVIWGGFKMLTSAGEPQKIAAARTTIFNALVGVVIAVVAAQIVGFIAGRLS